VISRDTVAVARHFVGGEWVDSTGAETITVVNPYTELPIGAVPAGSAEDVDAAVAAARAAFPGWAATPVSERVAVLSAAADLLEERAAALAELVARELGMPLKLALAIQVGLPIQVLRSMAAAVDEIEWREEVGNSLVLREPAGVVGAITPWNFPINQIVAKIAPALAAGCTVVVKPSEVTPLSALALAEVFDAAGLPAGVLNVVTGTGPVVGEAIVTHAGVDMVSFTGSTGAGRRVSELASRTVKPVTLELGGKSASVILEDADLARAVRAGVGSCFVNSGQMCSALTRMLVPRDRLGEAEELAVAAAERYTLGDPFDPSTRLGPLVSGVQRDRVQTMIRKGIADGARLLTGGDAAPDGLDRGYFVRPTVFSEVAPGMTIAQEEIFGPVLSVIPYDGEDDAVAIANGTAYGLAGAVWSADEDRALRVAGRLRTGQVDVNGGAFNVLAPFGGHKQSGHGREMGRFGVEEFLTLKAIQR
jgi:acyl-CoA reductase-like NAD-dependent aldehyde dehydrogenase